jgi:hypothetical protein
MSRCEEQHMSMSSTLTLNNEAASSQRFAEKQMVGIIEAIALHTYSLSNKGVIPADRELAAYIDSLSPADLLEMIRKHPSAASTRVQTASDEDLLHCARLVGRTTP